MGADMKNESRGRKTTEQPPWKTTYVRKLSTTTYHLVIHFPRPTVIIMVAERKNCVDCWVNWAVGHNLSLSSSFSLWRHCHVILLILKLADSFCYFSLTNTEWKWKFTSSNMKTNCYKLQWLSRAAAYCVYCESDSETVDLNYLCKNNLFGGSCIFPQAYFVLCESLFS